MDARRLDHFSRHIGRATGRRSLLAAVAGALVAGRFANETAAFDSTCTRFVLAAGENPITKFRHVDDDFLVEVRPKTGGGWRQIYFDNSGGANDVNGAHISPIEFRANVGDKLRITVFNRQAGGCEFDEVWLFCKGDRRGKCILRAYQCTSNEGSRLEEFITFETRIKP